MPGAAEGQGESNMGHVTQGDKDAHRRRLRRLVVVFCVVGLATVSAVFLLKLAEPKFYRVVTLPSHGGQPFRPFAMNDHGQIVGLVTRAAGGSGVALWDREQGIRELGIACDDGPLSINNLGQIAGIMIDPNGGTRAFRWDPQAGLTPLGQQGCRAFAINNRGQVTGDSGINVGQCHAYLWERTGAVRDLNPRGAWGSLAQHVNDSSQVLGLFGLEGHPCLWDLADPNSADWMALPREGDPYYSSLNNSGYVLCEMFRPAPAEVSGAWPQKYAVLWHKERDLTWLFPLADTDCRLVELNDANQVVYFETHRSALANWFPRWFSPRDRLFLWDPTCGKTSLDGYLNLGRGDSFLFRDLNNKGCLVGAVMSAKGVQKRAVLLELIAGKWRK